MTASSPLPIDTLDADILIIGAGGAGLLAALHIRETSPNLKIVIAVKGLLGQSGCTRMVQGGYNAVLNPNDSLERHFADTIKGGAYINNQELAWTLVAESPKRIVELENKAGCIFDRNPDGTIHQKPFAGQSFDRTVHKGDLTGIEIMSNLRDYMLETDIRILQECRGLDLLTNDGTVGGALLLDIRKGRLITVRAKATLLATGGGATMYRISSPSLEKSGDGMAMARRAGAEFVDMEMLQFHPTGLLVGTSIATGGLLEEGLRGAGARLYNGLGERYMERYDPKLERATRDVVSRSSYMEIIAGRGSPNGGVYIDGSHLGEEYMITNFPGMIERCADYGFDLVHDRVEVSPSAHFQMGGVTIDVTCRSSLDGLFAAGEDAGGVHGANRLGGNGVADSIVFGGVAGDNMIDYVTSRKSPSISAAQVTALSEHWTRPLTDTRGEKPFGLRQELEGLMWDKVGVVRNGADLESALDTLAVLRERAKRAGAAGPAASNPAWNALMDVTNLCDIGQMVAQGALIRTESRGAHYRLDCASPDPSWLKNVFLTPNGDGLDVHFEPVQFTRLTPPPEHLGAPAHGHDIR
jgi:succinate dehydrogenase / fumarate reductase flavoprotein subunit/fumarate reductase flavoprotein subunit